MELHTILIWYLALTQVGDYLTTTHILNHGGREINPIMDKLFDILGAPVALIVKSIMVVWLCYHDIMAAIIVSVIYTVVVAWNLYQIHKLKG